MHAVVMESLEEFLAGTLEPGELHSVEAHLGGCAACREEVQGIEDLNLLFGSLRPEEPLEASPAFYAQLMAKVSERTAALSWTNLFAFDPAWGRRLAVSCLLVLAAMGTYLVSSERNFVAGPMPDAVMAEQTQPAFASAPGTESMLITLASYEQ